MRAVTRRGFTRKRRTLQSERLYAYVADMNSIAPFRLTDRAAHRIAEIAASEGGTGDWGTALRVAVLAGGCSGFQYKFELDGQRAEDDEVIEQGAARVLIDPASLDLLAGAELDYTDELMGSHFAVRNPNAASSCGCGTSFSVADSSVD
jgi:iron-sulfur cluster insertion protein